MKKVKSKWAKHVWCNGLIFIAMLLTSVSAFPNIGTDWLESNQNPDGSYSLATDIATSFQSTTEVIRTSNRLDQSISGIAQGLLFINDESYIGLQYLHRKIITQIESGQPITDEITQLLSYQNDNGGFGEFEDYDSTNQDTAFALEAIAIAGGQNNPQLFNTIVHLIQGQNPDGGWGFSRHPLNNLSNAFTTAIVVNALAPYRVLYNLDTQIDAGAQYLIDQRNGNDLWGETSISALSLIALINTLPDLSEIADSLSALRTNQQANGSWGDDVYSTALALRAIFNAENPPVIDPSIPPPEALSRIEGKVIDSLTNQALSAALIRIEGTSVIETFTNTIGDFSISDLVEGDYSITVSKEGYAAISGNTSINPASTLDLGLIQLTPSENSTMATIRGQFHDVETELPLENVIMTLSGDSNQSASTDVNGEYQFSGVQAGAITVQATLSGYSTATFMGTIAASETLFISGALTPLENSDPVTSIRGTIIDGSNQLPLVGATVTLLGVNSDVTTTDVQGDYELANLNEGLTLITVSNTGYDTVEGETIVFTNSISHFSPLLYPENTTPTGANTTTITGTVIDAVTNLSIEGVSIEALFGTQNLTNNSNANGLFEISGITTSDGNLNFSKVGYESIDINVSLSSDGVVSIGEIQLLPLDVGPLQPDLSITSINLNSVTTNPQTLEVVGSIEATVTNIGTSETSLMATGVAFYDNDNDGIFDDSVDNTISTTSTITALQAGETESISFVIDSLSEFRDQPILLAIDSDQLILESNENNNVSSTSTLCTVNDLRTSDITVSELSYTEQALGGIRLQVRIGNAGFQDIELGAEVRFYEGDPNVGGVLIGGVTIPQLKSGEFADLALEDIVTITGDRDIYAIADELNGVDECVESNNAISIPALNLMSDLVMTSIDDSAMVNDLGTGDVSGSLNIEISNQGAVATREPYTVSVFFDQNGNGELDPTDPVLGEQLVVALLGVTQIVNIDVLINGNLPFRDAPVTAKVDSRHNIDETNESNNMNDTTISCLGEPEPIGDFAQKLKWYYNSPWALFGPPMTGQLNDDNGDGVINEKDMPDLVFVGSGNDIKALDGDTGALIWSTPANGNRVGSVALGDIDSDGKMEVVFVDNSRNRLIALENTGAPKWNVATGPTMSGPRDGLAIADIDHDGNPEIVHGSRVYNSNGSLRWIGNYDGANNSNYGYLPLVADIDLQGDMEIIAGRTVYRSNGNAFFHKSSIPADGYNAIGNFDDDDFPEIVLVTRGRLYLLEHNGEIKWGPKFISGRGGPPTVADFDGDGQPEIGIAGSVRYYAFETNGSTKWTKITQDRSSNRTGSSAFDFNGDGKIEIVYGDEVNFFVLDGRNGNEVLKLKNGSGTTLEYPYVVDIDNDGHAEIVLVSNNSRYSTSPFPGIRVLEGANDNWMPTRNIWNQHTYHINNVNDDGTIPQYEEPSWLGHNTYRLNTFPDRDPLALADLTASRLQVIDNGFGQPIELTARIGNAGAAPSLSNVRVLFYQGDPQTGGVLVGTTTLDPLNPNQFLDVSTPATVSITNGEDIIVIVDSDNIVDECNELNNRADAPAPTSIRADIEVATDAPVYGPESDVVLEGMLTNTGGLSGIFSGQLQIEDLNGDMVVVFPAQDVGLLNPGQAVMIVNDWNTGLTVTGNYILRGTITDANGVVQDEATTLFAISNSVSTMPLASLNTTTDRFVYHTTDLVEISDLVRNITTNHIIEDASLALEVRDPNGMLILNETIPLAQLVPHAIMSLNNPLPLIDADVGGYQVVGTIYSQEGGILDSDSAAFEVIQMLERSFMGSVEVEFDIVEMGEPQICTDAIQNTSTISIENQAIRQILVNVEAEAVLSSDVSTLDFTANEQISLDRVIDSADLELGFYACVLQALTSSENGIEEWSTLDHAVFEVIEPPIKLTGEISEGTRGRILILLDDPSGSGNDPLGPNHLPSLAEQRAYLEQLLDSAGWTYTITETNEDFTDELRSGQYVTYLLLSEQEKLTEQMQKELREAVYRGEGLIEGGSHDQRQGRIDDALGIKFKGKLPHVSGVELNGMQLGSGGGLFTISDKPLRAELGSAEAAGFYLNSSASVSNNPAVTTEQYGEGESVYIGFDVLAEATLSNDNDGFYAQLLLDTLDLAHPDILVPIEGRVYPVILTVTNEGNATPGRAIITLPGVTEITSSSHDIDLTSDGIIWVFDLDVEETKTLTLEIVLPETDVNASILIQSGIDPDWVEQAILSINLIQIDGGGLTEAIQATSDDKAYKKTNKWLDKAKSSFDQQDYSRALSELTQASDEITKINVGDYPEADQIRLWIDQSIRHTEMRL